MKESAYRAIVDIVKAAACIMIFLYHCNTILPGEWKFITIFGQDLGNNLFFMVSGFALASSIDRTGWRGFPAWYLKRLVRILPITIIAYIAAYIMGYYSFADRAQLFAVFIYPTLYWFITCILLFYIVLFAIAKITKAKVQLFICMVLAVLYILLAGRQERLYVIGLLSMLAGYITKNALDRMTENSGKKYLKYFMAELIISLPVFIVGEYTENKYLAAVLILLSSQAGGTAMLSSGYICNEKLTGILSSRLRLRKTLKYIGDMALPLYLVQCFCSGYIGFWIGQHIDFPVSFLVNLIVVWVIGTLLYLCSLNALP